MAEYEDPRKIQVQERREAKARALNNLLAQQLTRLQALTSRLGTLTQRVDV